MFSRKKAQNLFGYFQNRKKNRDKDNENRHRQEIKYQDLFDIFKPSLSKEKIDKPDER